MNSELERAIKSAARGLAGPGRELDDILVGSAANEALLDVAYASVDSPRTPGTRRRTRWSRSLPPGCRPGC